MAFLLFSPAMLGIIFVIAILIFFFVPRNSKLPPGTKRIPGPRGLPWLGSVPELPGQHAWLQFYKWAQTYGPLCQVTLAGDNVVLISDPKIAEALLVKRQEIYSSRVHFPAIWGNNDKDVHYLPLMAMGPDHKRVKLFAKKLVASVPKEHLREVTGERVKKMILDMLQEPLNFQLLLEHCCAGISSTIAWGDKSPETASETVDRSNQLLEGISPESIENKLPFLEKVPEWVPGFLQPWRVFERARAARERAFWLGQREQTKEKLINEKDLYTWTKESLKDETLNEEEKAYTVGMLALIGGVLESAPIQGWFVAMVKFPEWQKRGQEEVDAVCGDRMPNAADIQKLPVVRSLLRETFRWRTPVPFGVPHMLEQDDVYDGYHIPKNSLCFALEWAMNRDEALYPDAENYNPARWLEPSYPTYREPLTTNPSIKNHSGFGWGRRTCAGQDYSEQVLLTIVASILWSCNIVKRVDPVTGLEIELPWMDYGPFVIVKPNPVPLDIKPRDEWRVKVLSS